MKDSDLNLNQGSNPARIPDPRPSFPGQPSPAVTPITVAAEIKLVDRRTIEGSYDGQTDEREFADKDASVSTQFAKDSPGPREPRGQSQVMSSKLDSPSANKTAFNVSEASRS